MDTAFDPDQYLQEKQSSGGFDPDAYLAQKQGQEQPQGMWDKTKNAVKDAWNALAIPEQMSRKGLGMLSAYVPNPESTGNLPMDILKGTPKIAADTLAQVAPGFISRGAILTSAALKGAQAAAPLFKSAARGLGSQLESASGSMPGSLEAAYKDPSLIFSPGKEAAKPLYEAAQQELPQGANLFNDMWKPEDIVSKAQEYISQGGKLEPSEALQARKAVDSLLKSKRYVKDTLMGLRDTFDEMAKSSENIAQADPLFKRGLMASSLRNILPQNKYGGTSAFKMAIGPALTGIGSIGGPGGAATGAALAGGVLSPAIQGAAATGAGLVSKAISPLVNNPAVGVALQQLGETIKKLPAPHGKFVRQDGKIYKWDGQEYIEQ